VAKVRLAFKSTSIGSRSLDPFVESYPNVLSRRLEEDVVCSARCALPRGEENQPGSITVLMT
jgi:hypothetical protein